MLKTGCCGPKREEVTGGWRKEHNEKLHSTYFAPNITRVIISRRMRLVVHAIYIGEMRNAHRIVVKKPEGKRTFGRPRHREEGDRCVSEE
jgi:hypothetical protein